MKDKLIRNTAIGLLLAAALLTGCASQSAAPAQPEPTAAEPTEAVEPENAYAPDSFDPSAYKDSDHKQAVNIDGCDTFTQIVNKLEDGQGYANVNIGEDVLLVSSGTYEWEAGSLASIDAEIFAYKDGMPTYIGYAEAGGTAAPLAVKDVALYVCAHHYINTYTVKDGALVLTEEAYETFDKDGAATYYYRSGDTSFADHDEAAAHARFDELFAELDDAEVICFDKADSSAAVTLPPYEYPGPELFYTVVYQYIIDEFSQHYDEADVGIPCPIIVAEDFSDKNDLRLWGDFTYINYELDGDVLESVSGGSYPGLMHIKDTGDGYEVTGIDVVKDGSEFTESAKEIFGKYFEDYLEASADEEGRDAIRAQIIANYAAANGLNITAFHDYGWEPVPLPEENIDSFYSDLD